MALFLTFSCALIISLAECQSIPFTSNGSNSFGSPGPNGFLGFWTALAGGQKQCGGCSGGCSSCGCSGCGSGPSVNVVNNVNGDINVNYNNNFYPGPITENPLSTSTTSPSTISTTSSSTTAPVCQVSIQGGPYYLNYCSSNSYYLDTSVSTSGCGSVSVTFQLSGLPCAYVQTDGTVVFDRSMGCYVGQGTIYYGTLTAVDSYSGTQYGSASITVDTSGLQYCSSTTTTTGTPACTVTYYTVSTYYPTECNQIVLTPYVQGCAYSQVSYSLAGMVPCVRVQSDGSVIIDLNGAYCSVGFGATNYGTLTATDGYTGNQLGSWYITVDLTNLVNCITTTSPWPTDTTTTSSSTTQVPCSVSFVPNQSHYSPVNCSQMLSYTIVTGCPYNRVLFQLTGFPPCLEAINFGYNFGPTPIVFTPIRYNQQFLCDVGQGITYSGALSATDYGVWPAVSLGTWDLTVDTSGLEHCVGSSYIDPIYPYCGVDLSPRSYPATYRPTICERNVMARFTLTPGCQYFQFDIRYELTGFESCDAVQIVNGELIFDVSNGSSCNITSGQYHTGVLKIYTSFGDQLWSSVDFQVLTGGLQHCADVWAGTTTTALPVTP